MSFLRGHLVEPLQAGGPHPDGVLLHGRAGVGKSMLAEAAAKESGANLIVVGGPELFSKWLGESEETMRHVFKLALELAPCVVFFDQLDAIAPIRGRGRGTWTTGRVVHQFLAELDDLGPQSMIAVIGATNRLDLIDPAVLKPGCLGTLLRIELPDQNSRTEILSLYLRSYTAVVDLAYLVDGTSGWSGAELRAFAEALTRQGDAVSLALASVLLNGWTRRRQGVAALEVAGDSSVTSRYQE